MTEPKQGACPFCLARMPLDEVRIKQHVDRHSDIFKTRRMMEALQMIEAASRVLLGTQTAMMSLIDPKFSVESPWRTQQHHEATKLHEDANNVLLEKIVPYLQGH